MLGFVDKINCISDWMGLKMKVTIQTTHTFN